MGEPGWSAHFLALQGFSLSLEQIELAASSSSLTLSLPVALSKVTLLCSKANTKSEG